MSPTSRARAFDAFLRIALGCAFVGAGVIKIADPAQFAGVVDNYHLLPRAFLNPVAILLPWLEMVAGLSVLVGFWTRAGALLLSVLTIVFFLAISSALVRGLNIECGCFGTVSGSRIGLQHLALDGAVFGLAALLIWRMRTAALHQ
jgi:putative oxidoreductase